MQVELNKEAATIVTEVMKHTHAKDASSVIITQHNLIQLMMSVLITESENFVDPKSASFMEQMYEG